MRMTKKAKKTETTHTTNMDSDEDEDSDGDDDVDNNLPVPLQGGYRNARISETWTTRTRLPRASKRSRHDEVDPTVRDEEEREEGSSFPRRDHRNAQSISRHERETKNVVQSLRWAGHLRWLISMRSV